MVFCSPISLFIRTVMRMSQIRNMYGIYILFAVLPNITIVLTNVKFTANKSALNTIQMYGRLRVCFCFIS